MSVRNNCGFIGRLTHEPEVKVTTSNKKVCSFSLAVECGWGENKKVIYPEFVAWNGQAEFVGKLSKGTLVAVDTQLDIRSWEGNDGSKKKKCEFVVRDIMALDSKRTSAAGEYGEHDEDAPIEVGDEEMPF